MISVWNLLLLVHKLPLFVLLCCCNLKLSCIFHTIPQRGRDSRRTGVNLLFPCIACSMRNDMFDFKMSNTHFTITFTIALPINMSMKLRKLTYVHSVPSCHRSPSLVQEIKVIRGSTDKAIPKFSYENKVIQVWKPRYLYVRVLAKVVDKIPVLGKANTCISNCDLMFLPVECVYLSTFW